MKKLEITSLTSRGQIVIPQEVRKEMHLSEGEKFVVVGSGDTIVLKKISMPSLNELDKMLKKSHEHAKKHKLTEKDMWDVIKKARSRL